MHDLDQPDVASWKIMVQRFFAWCLVVSRVAEKVPSLLQHRLHGFGMLKRLGGHVALCVKLLRAPLVCVVQDVYYDAN